MKGQIVYFVQDAETKNIKIGVTTALASRLQVVRHKAGGHRMIVLGCIYPGNRFAERSLHQRFGDFHLQNEWFSPADELLDYIAQNTASYAVISARFSLPGEVDEGDHIGPGERKRGRPGGRQFDESVFARISKAQLEHLEKKYNSYSEGIRALIDADMGVVSNGKMLITVPAATVTAIKAERKPAADEGEESPY